MSLAGPAEHLHRSTVLYLGSSLARLGPTWPAAYVVDVEDLYGQRDGRNNKNGDRFRVLYREGMYSSAKFGGESTSTDTAVGYPALTLSFSQSSELWHSTGRSISRVQGPSGISFPFTPPCM